MSDPESLSALYARLPPPPPAELGPCLDATAICLARHGLTRTSMTDVAAEMGVARSTVYRQVGSVENASWLLMSREMHKLYATLPETFALFQGAQATTRALAKITHAISSDPVLSKVLRDEPDFVGRTITRRLSALLDQAAEMLAPLFSAAMDSGIIRRHDPLVLAHWIMRIVTSMILAPPPTDLDQLYDDLLLPALEPAGTANTR